MLDSRLASELNGGDCAASTCSSHSAEATKETEGERKGSRREENERQNEAKRKKKRKQLDDSQPLESGRDGTATAGGLDSVPSADLLLSGLRLFKKVPKGLPVRIHEMKGNTEKGERQVFSGIHLTNSRSPTESSQPHQPGIPARERILGSTRYAVVREEVDKSICSLGADADQLVRAESDAIEKRKQEKKAASLAESLRRKSVDAAAAEGKQAEEQSEKKKKKRKKAKIEATVICAKPFVPHELRIATLIGRAATKQ